MREFPRHELRFKKKQKLSSGDANTWLQPDRGGPERHDPERGHELQRCNRLQRVHRDDGEEGQQRRGGRRPRVQGLRQGRRRTDYRRGYCLLVFNSVKIPFLFKRMTVIFSNHCNP